METPFSSLAFVRDIHRLLLFIVTWWRHQMETFSALLALCEGNPPGTDGSSQPHPHPQRPALLFYLICVWTNGWANNRDAVDLRRHRAHYDVTNWRQWIDGFGVAGLDKLSNKHPRGQWYETHLRSCDIILIQWQHSFIIVFIVTSQLFYLLWVHRMVSYIFEASIN